MKIKRLNNYHTDENTYLVYDETTKDGFVIDPGYHADGVLTAAKEDQVNIKFILITHCHYDHISGLEELREKTGAPLVSGEKCAVNVTDPDINLSLGGLGMRIFAKKPEIVLSDGQEITIGQMRIKCINTPGHTNCSVCYECGGHLFSGDTLFLRNVGRWDLPTGDEDSLVRSIQERLYCLDEDMTVHPGHGADTTVGYEKKFNLYVKGQ